MKIAMKQPKKNAPTPAEVARKAAQDWLPINDLHDGCLIRADGAVVGGIAISPLSLALKSDNEKRAIVSAVHSAINNLTVPWQILSLYRPVELDAYIDALDAKLADSDPHRKVILRDYLMWVHGLIQSGEAVERRYYLLVERKGADAIAEHRSSLTALADDLQRAQGMRVRILDNDAWLDLLTLAFHASQSAIETTPNGLRIPPILRGGAVNG